MILNEEQKKELSELLLKKRKQANDLNDALKQVIGQIVLLEEIILKENG